MKKTDRILSALLALSLCFGLMTPAVLAVEVDVPVTGGIVEEDVRVEEDFPTEEDVPAEEEILTSEAETAIKGDLPVEGLAASGEITAAFTAGGAWTPTKVPTDRVWLNVTGNDVVVDSFTYAVTSDKDADSVVGAKAADRYNVDEYGYITLKAGKTPITGEKLTVTATVDYFDGEDVVFADNVVDTTKLFTVHTESDVTKSYDYAISDASAVVEGKTTAPAQVARTGKYGITSCEGVRNATPIKDVAAENVTMTAWYYDPVETGVTPLDADSDVQMGIHMNAGGAVNMPNKYALGIAAIKNNTSSGTNYYQRTSTKSASGSWVAGEARSEGWHKMEWVISPAGTQMLFDGVTKYTDSTTTALAQIALTTNKGSNPGGSVNPITKAVIENRHFLDDISVVKTAATAKSKTVAIDIPVDYVAPSMPVIGTQPANQRAAVGEDASFTVEATDPASGALTYQWYSCDAQGANGVAVDTANVSAKTKTLTLTNLVAGESYYYCTVTNANGDTKSSVAKLTVLGENDRLETPRALVLDPNGVLSFGYTDAGAAVDFTICLYRENGASDTLLNTLKKSIQPDHSNFVTGVSLLAELRAAGVGEYYCTVQAMGTGNKLDSLVSDNSNLATAAKLATPEAPIWAGYSLKWAEVPAAKGYRVQLYKDGAVSGEPISTDATVTSLLMTLGSTGVYTGTVTAIADTETLAADSLPSAQSAAKGADSLKLSFEPGAIHKGDAERVTLEAPNAYGILGFAYKSSNEKVTIDQDGTITVADDLAVPVEGIDVTITGEVEYYPTTVWANNMESYGRFTNNELNTVKGDGARLHLTDTSEVEGGQAARTGRMGATPYAKNGHGSNVALAEATTGSLFFWYYDPYTAAEHAAGGVVKHGIALNVHGAADPAATNFAGLAYGDGAALNGFYGYRTSGTDWKNLATPRATGWHKFEFRVTSDGMELYIDNVKARELDTSITEITGLQLCNNWGTQSDAGTYVNGKHFIDDIFVVKEASKTEKTTLTTTVKVLPKSYSISPANSKFDLNYPEDTEITVSPNLTDLVSVKLGETALTADKDYTVADGTLTLKSTVLSAKAEGEYTISLTMADTQVISCKITVTKSASREYYMNSASGNDEADGLTPATAWKSLAKLNAAAPFTFGDKIYLEANSVWNGQLILTGDGRANKAIIMTRYTVENGVTKYGADCATQTRPIINGGGTNGTRPSYIVEGNSSGAIKLNGAVELWNAGYWEISWLEVTNMGTDTGDGRSGIMVMNDYAPTQAARTQENWWASRKDHVFITDCYVHDVNGRHQADKGTKHAGGIIGYGYLSDFRVERCRVSKVDNEGIRNTIFNPGGTNSSAGYPANAETYLTFKNNFIDKVAGDAMVMAGGNHSDMSYNVATTLGLSYVTAADGTNLAPGAAPVLLGTQNYAAMWVMGCKNSVAQFNEVFDTQYDCPDGEAWDIDLYSENYIYQYNYSHNNAGGCVLFMNQSKNNIFRYNLSINDGGHYTQITADRKHLIYYAASGSGSSNAYPLIYNNVFNLSDDISSIFDGNKDNSKYIHMQNNIFYAPTDNRPRLIFKAEDKALGELTNNIFWPADLYGTNITDQMAASALVEDNQTVDPKLKDMSKTPVISDTWFAEWDTNKALRSANWFDANVARLDGYSLLPDSTAIDAGVKVPYWADIPEEDRFPLTRDFFGTPMDETAPGWTPDIGIHEYTVPVPEGSFKVSFNANGGTAGTPSFVVVKNGETVVTLPTEPTRLGNTFTGWNTAKDGTGTAFTATTPVMSDLVVYAQWKPLHYTYTVTFDKNGGDTEASPAAKTISEPATTLGSLPKAPHRADFAFVGWNTAADGSGSIFLASTKVSGSITVYAQWKPVGAFTVTYDKNGGDTEASPVFQIVNPPALNVGTLPGAPTRSGYTFAGWNTAKDGTGTAFAADTAVSANLKLYAQWTAESGSSSGRPVKPTPEKPAEDVNTTEGGAVTVKENRDGSRTYNFKSEEGKKVVYVRVNGLLIPAANSYTAQKGEDPSIVVVFGTGTENAAEKFADVAALPDYAQKAVGYVTSAGLFNGVTERDFAPEKSMDRAMFATVLARLYGAKTDAYVQTAAFGDVPADAWYGPSVAWAAEMGVVDGVGDGQFAPRRALTRQELVTLVHRFAVKVEADTTATGELTAYPDAQQTATWASDAMKWAVGLGLINGRGADLAPTETITRGEAAIILERMATLLVKAK